MMIGVCACEDEDCHIDWSVGWLFVRRAQLRQKIKTFLPIVLIRYDTTCMEWKRLSSFLFILLARSLLDPSRWWLLCRRITKQLDEIIAKYFYLFCATELIPKRRLPTMRFVRLAILRQFWHRCNVSLLIFCKGRSPGQKLEIFL